MNISSRRGRSGDIGYDQNPIDPGRRARRAQKTKEARKAGFNIFYCRDTRCTCLGSSNSARENMILCHQILLPRVLHFVKGFSLGQFFPFLSGSGWCMDDPCLYRMRRDAGVLHHKTKRSGSRPGLLRSRSIWENTCPGVA